MAGQSSQDVLAQTVDLFSQRVQEYANGIAQRLGQPMSGTQLTKDQVLDRWNYTPLGDTQAADQHFHQLVAQGMPAGQALDAVYPFRKMLIKGPDLRSQIDTAKQIAGWAADASGQPPPAPVQMPAMPLLSGAQQGLPAAPQQVPAPPQPPPPPPAPPPGPMASAVPPPGLPVTG